jgi:hypothetical protein
MGATFLELALFDPAGLALDSAIWIGGDGANSETRRRSAMNTIRSLPFPSVRHDGLGSLSWLIAGGVLAAMLELGFAIAWWAPQGGSATRVLQSVAAWWIGRDAFAGGATSALLGVLLYCLLMIAVVALYALATRRWRVLLRRPLSCGAAYGAVMYVLVLEIAVPLLAAYPAGDRSLTWRLACLVAYMLLVGVTAALFARRADECAHVAPD